MRPISAAQRDNVLSLLSSGLSTRDIAAQTGVSKSKVSNIAKEYEPDKENLQGGRRRKLTPTDQRAVLSLVRTGKASDAVAATKHINTIIPEPVTVQTVRNVLKEHRLKAYVKKKRPFLSPKHRKARLAFAQKYQNWTVEDWKRVVWSDETKINQFGSDGRKYIWKQQGEPLGDRGVEPTVKFGGGHIMVWGCMGWNGVGILSEVEGKMDAKQYVNILQEGLVESIQKLEVPEEKVIFQQDNDPKHTSKLASNWFEEQGIPLLDWPAQSPDLNPIEHLWNLLKRDINGYEMPASGVWELWERAEVEWGKIRPEECQKLIESMPRRLEAVIKAKGGHTKY
jgi:transposase